jgi:hypothetical protein
VKLQKFYVAGEPQLLEPDDFILNARQARETLDEEATRTRTGFRPGSVHNSLLDLEPQAPSCMRTLAPVRDSPLPVPDPAGRPGSLPPSGLKQDADFVRQIIPELAHMSDTYLTSHSLDKLQKYVLMSKKKDKDKKEKDLEARMGQNLELAVARPVTISGQDNRVDKLHPARFLPGVAAPLANSWLEARKLWGREPADAVAEFDMLAL